MILIKSWQGILIVAFLVGIDALLAGCAQQATKGGQPAKGTLDPDTFLKNHVIEFDGDGNAVEPYKQTRLTYEEGRNQQQQILNEMKSFLERQKHPKILIFVHGGLVTQASALGEAKFGLMYMAGADPECYPLFVVWDSSLGGSYGEHLFEVRQGRKDSDTLKWAPITSPVYFLCDMLVAVSRAPTVWIQQRVTDNEAIGAAAASINSYEKAAKPEQGGTPAYREAWMQRRSANNAVLFYWVLQKRYFESQHPKQSPTTAGSSTQPAAMAISIGRDQSHPSDWYWRGTTYTLTMPTKMLLAPVIDGLGTPAWQDMNRRSMTVIEGSYDFEMNSKTTAQRIDDYIDRGTTGGLALFIRELAQQIHGEKNAGDYQVTLVAHSAGTLIVNELLRRQLPADPSAAATDPATTKEADARLPVNDIVYMAAACSIRDFAGSVIPFMQLDQNKGTRFHLLCLHPSAELLDTEGFDLPPRGSLLCWIDDFLTRPTTPLDRTLGRWENILQVPYVIPPAVRGRVTIKAFDYLRRPNDPASTQPGKCSTPQMLEAVGIDGPFQQETLSLPVWDPQMHGNFSSSPYWDPGFWQPSPSQESRSGQMLIVARQAGAAAPAATAPATGPAISAEP